MAVYYVYSGAAGSANGSSWVNAYTTLAAGITGKAAGETLYVAHDHAESTSGNLSIGNVTSTPSNPIKLICVNRSGSVPPVSADLRATAQVTTTGAGNITFTSGFYIYGIIFFGNTSTIPAITMGTDTNTALKFDNCSLRSGATATSLSFGLNNGVSAGGYIELVNTTLSFGNVGSGTRISCDLRWRNTASALLGTITTALFNFGNSSAIGRGAMIECIGVDLSAAGSGKTLVNTASATPTASRARFVDCKLDAAVTKSVVPPGPGALEVDFIRTGSAGVNYAVTCVRYTGTLTEETTIVRTSGGATDGTTKISWKVVTTATCGFTLPFECPVIAIWNDTTGSAKTATIECIGAAIATDQEVWVELEYLGDAASPQGSFINDGKADILATAANQTSSSETWGGSTAAFKLAVTFTAQQRGWVYCRVKIGKASSTFYIDPLVTLT